MKRLLLALLLVSGCYKKELNHCEEDLKVSIDTTDICQQTIDVVQGQVQNCMDLLDIADGTLEVEKGNTKIYKDLLKVQEGLNKACTGALDACESVLSKEE